MSHTPKFTPGPWKDLDLRYQQNGQIRILSDGPRSSDEYGVIANVLRSHRQCEANARLIAAAPDLLDFVRGIFNATACVCRLNKIVEPLGAGVPCTRCDAEKLIAKAEGK